MTQDPIPREVRAARQRLNDYRDQPENVPQIAAATTPGTETRSLSALRDIILNAEDVTIVGVLPWQVSASIIGLKQPPLQDHRKIVRYVTPSRDLVASYRKPGVLGLLVQKWMAGVTGVRNWALPARGDGSDTEVVTDLTLYEIDDLFMECVVVARQGNRVSVHALLELPRPGLFVEQPSGNSPPLLIHEIRDESKAELVQYVHNIAQSAQPLIPRQVRCVVDDMSAERTEGDEFKPIVARISPYSHPDAGEVEPIAVVAVLTSTAEGRSIVLKRRTKSNARDDFDKLSMISERILAEDLGARPVHGDALTDLKAYLDHLWVSSGAPDPFILDERVFRVAAQRELFLSLGLDVSADRLNLCGTCLLDREEEPTFLGFYVYVLDLVRSADPKSDELVHARTWNPNLEVVPLSKLYGTRYRTLINRLLRRRETWLKTNVFRQVSMEDSGSRGRHANGS